MEEINSPTDQSPDSSFGSKPQSVAVVAPEKAAVKTPSPPPSERTESPKDTSNKPTESVEATGGAADPVAAKE
jgi:hypothetical protein